jgi:hypothetical protein
VGKTVDLPLVGRLGPSFSRLDYSGGNGEAMPLSLWNKSLRLASSVLAPVPVRDQ